MRMDAKHLLERVLILAVLFITILQLGGAVVRADMDRTVTMQTDEAPGERLAGKYSRLVGCPRSDLEACRMLMQLFQ
jgi:hypothetical protein